MNKDLTLLIMAAGMGSRFGSLKQIEPIGPGGEFIIDYSIYDAIKVGFNKVVFIIKEENYDIFRDTIGKRIENQIKVEYVFQKNDNIPSKYNLSGRIKPLGTAHAILCAKDTINENFVVINADDFYGRESFKVIKDFMENAKDNEYALVGYNVANTLTENGSVKRGICMVKDGYLEDIIESSVVRENGVIKATPLNESLSEMTLKDNDPVSMNMLGFTKNIFNYIDERLEDFLESNKHDFSKCEFLIPDILKDLVSKGKVTCKIIPTNAKWEGVTYKEDKEKVVNSIRKLIDEGEYNEKLWEEAN